MPSGRSACAARAVLTENRGLLTSRKSCSCFGEHWLAHVCWRLVDPVNFELCPLMVANITYKSGAFCRLLE